MRSLNALDTLWGGPERRRKNTAKAMISPGARPQDIRTPLVIFRTLVQYWGESIALDACDGEARTPCVLHLTSGGLDRPWADRTYCNPPYQDLKSWLAKAVHEARATGNRIAVLCPVRTHRKWFREAMAETSAIIYLDPLTFEGYTQAFPAPLCILFFNSDDPADPHAFQNLGGVL